MNQLVTRTAKDLKLNSDGTPIFDSMGDKLLYADSLVKSGILPNSYKNASQVVAAMQMAAELGIQGGVNSLKKTAVINGSPSIFGELPLSICYDKGVIADFDGYHFDIKMKQICLKNLNIFSKIEGYYCRILRTGAKTYVEGFYTLAMAKAAGLGNVWNKHPDDMLRHRTIAKVLKTMAPDILCGVSVAEYDHNAYANEDMVTVQSNVSNSNAPEESELNEIVDATIIEPNTMEKKDSMACDLPLTSDEPTQPPVIEAEVVKEEILEEVEPLIMANFVVRMGTHEGKKLGDIDHSELMASFDGLSKHLSTKAGQEDPLAKEYYASIKLYMEEKSGI
jgi:hypothetical protein